MLIGACVSFSLRAAGEMDVVRYKRGGVGTGGRGGQAGALSACTACYCVLMLTA